jgi:hypothetical protein
MTVDVKHIKFDEGLNSTEKFYNMSRSYVKLIKMKLMYRQQEINNPDLSTYVLGGIAPQQNHQRGIIFKSGDKYLYYLTLIVCIACHLEYDEGYVDGTDNDHPKINYFEDIVKHWNTTARQMHPATLEDIQTKMFMLIVSKLPFEMNHENETFKEVDQAVLEAFEDELKDMTSSLVSWWRAGWFGQGHKSDSYALELFDKVDDHKFDLRKAFHSNMYNIHEEQYRKDPTQYVLRMDGVNIDIEGVSTTIAEEVDKITINQSKRVIAYPAAPQGAAPQGNGMSGVDLRSHAMHTLTIFPDELHYS